MRNLFCEVFITVVVFFFVFLRFRSIKYTLNLKFWDTVKFNEVVIVPLSILIIAVLFDYYDVFYENHF